MRIIRIVVVGLLTLFALGIGGCDSSASGPEATAGWATFESNLVSLRLPESFVGGDPSRQSVMAALRERAASSPLQDTRAELDQFLDDVADHVDNPGVERVGWLLVAWGPPDADGYMAKLTVNRYRMEGNLLVDTGGDASMEALVQAVLWQKDSSEWSVEQMTDDRAHVVAVYPREPDRRDERQRIVFQVAHGYVYAFRYTYYGPSDATMDSAFLLSSETATVKGPR